jgi:hypothetical protein
VVTLYFLSEELALLPDLAAGAEGDESEAEDDFDSEDPDSDDLDSADPPDLASPLALELEPLA